MTTVVIIRIFILLILVFFLGYSYHRRTKEVAMFKKHVPIKGWIGKGELVKLPFNPDLDRSMLFLDGLLLDRAYYESPEPKTLRFKFQIDMNSNLVYINKNNRRLQVKVASQGE